jgi:hypothetical protein
MGRGRPTNPMSNDGLTREIETVTLLLAVGFDGGENVLDELTIKPQR